MIEEENQIAFVPVSFGAKYFAAKVENRYFLPNNRHKT